MFGGPEVTEANRLWALDDEENAKLRKFVAKAMLAIAARTDISIRKW